MSEFDLPEETPESLAQWLDNMHKRLGEYEDKQAANMLRKLSAEVERLTNENAELLLGLTAANDATDRLTAWKKTVERAPLEAYELRAEKHANGTQLVYALPSHIPSYVTVVELIARPSKEPQA